MQVVIARTGFVTDNNTNPSLVVDTSLKKSLARKKS